MKVEPGIILKLFLNFSNFEPQYSYRLYSYKKKSVLQLLAATAKMKKTQIIRSGMLCSENEARKT